MIIFHRREDYPEGSEICFPMKAFRMQEKEMCFPIRQLVLFGIGYYYKVKSFEKENLILR
jgi:hypothetical protein